MQFILETREYLENFQKLNFFKRNIMETIPKVPEEEINVWQKSVNNIWRLDEIR